MKNLIPMVGFFVLVVILFGAITLGLIFANLLMAVYD